MGELSINIKSNNLYTALLFDGINDPDSYVAAGFHKLLDGGKYAEYDGLEYVKVYI